jgi:outer membrane protein assembly factor BamB
MIMKPVRDMLALKSKCLRNTDMKKNKLYQKKDGYVHPISKGVKRILVIILMSLFTFGLNAGELTGWRNNGTGVFPEASPPTEWAKDKNVVWSTPIPKWGNGSPVLVGNRIFVTAEPGTLICINAEDGKILWEKGNDYVDVFSEEEMKKAKEGETLRKQIGGIYNQINKKPHDLALYKKMAELSQKIADDPANEEKIVLAGKVARPRTHGANGYATPTPVCDGKHVYIVTGKGIVACYDLDGNRKWIRLVDKTRNGYGHSASPVIVDNKLIVHMGDKISALNPEDGKTVWETKGGTSWGTPLPVKIGGKDAVITTHSQIVRVSDGKVIGKAPISLPWNSAIEKDGIVYYFDERGAGAAKLPAEMSDSVKMETVWQQKKAPKNRYYASPVLINGVLFGVNCVGQLTALDAGKGDILFSQKLDLKKGNYYSSLVAAGGNIYVTIENGATLVCKAGRTFEKVCENKQDKLRSCLLPSGTRLYIRTLKGLMCTGK